MIRIRTTGGGGWGDPLDRPVGEVLRDGVVLGDRDATEAVRARRKARLPLLFDRGLGYRVLAGKPYPEVDRR